MTSNIQCLSSAIHLQPPASLKHGITSHFGCVNTFSLNLFDLIMSYSQKKQAVEQASTAH